MTNDLATLVATLETMTPRVVCLNLDSLTSVVSDTYSSHVDSVRYVRMLLDGTISEDV